MNKNRLIFPGFWFGRTSETDALEMARRGAGGFCIYGGTVEKVQQLAARLRAASPHKHLFICADYEDGLGRWIPGEPWVLSNMAVGTSSDEEISYQKGLTLAQQARRVGVDWVFAPVLDLADEPQNPIVNTRSFGAEPQTVGRLGAALCRGLSDGGVLNSIKHFPGHGRTTQDSHLGLPVLHRTAAQLAAHELIPFQTALPYADSVMAGHLLLPDLDEKYPASLSHAVCTHLLKKQLGFDGLVLTDALCMKAIGDEKQAALHALHAGAHILLAPENPLALSDFLAAQTTVDTFVRTSEKWQDKLAARLQAAAPKAALSPQDFNTRYSAACAVWQGAPLQLSDGQTVSYIELGNEEDFAAQPFLRALQTRGIHVCKWNGAPADILLAVSFSNYKAFKGHINLSADEQTVLARAAAAHQQSIFISFGSPFGTENITPLTARLFCFSPAEQMQTYAADILLGRQTARGKMPV